MVEKKTLNQNYILKIEQICAIIFDIRHRYNNDYETILNDVYTYLKTNPSKHKSQSSISQYLNEGEGVYKP